jgi:HD superfamily phosphohydrolase
LKLAEAVSETPKDRTVNGGLRDATPEGHIDPAMGTEEQKDPFEDRYEFLDDVHGTIELSQLETDTIDSPEFQRLFRLGQLGFVDLVYPTANHTRATHSIGACYCAKKLIRALRANTRNLNRAIARAGGTVRPQISEAERVLISVAGLLHDIPHGPFSHDIEKKTHHIYPHERLKKVKSFYGPYEKHDNFEENPALYVFLMDVRESVLARVLERHSPAFARLLLGADTKKTSTLGRVY